jgi:hypothetical protein
MIAIVTAFMGVRHSARRLRRNRVPQLQAVSDIPFFRIQQTGKLQEQTSEMGNQRMGDKIWEFWEE